MQPAAPDRRHADHRHELPEGLETCARVVAGHFRGELPERAMHDAVTRFAIRMHAVEVPPERALATLKDAILRVPEVSARPAMERGELLRVLVETAIRGYYAHPGDAARAGRAM